MTLILIDFFIKILQVLLLIKLLSYFKDKNGKEQATTVGKLVISLPEKCFSHQGQRQFEVDLEFNGTEINISISTNTKIPIDFMLSSIVKYELCLVKYVHPLIIDLFYILFFLSNILNCFH